MALDPILKAALRMVLESKDPKKALEGLLADLEAGGGDAPEPAPKGDEGGAPPPKKPPPKEPKEPKDGAEPPPAAQRVRAMLANHPNLTTDQRAFAMRLGSHPGGTLADAERYVGTLPTRSPVTVIERTLSDIDRAMGMPGPAVEPITRDRAGRLNISNLPPTVRR
jgi:hypothetical protein